MQIENKLPEATTKEPETDKVEEEVNLFRTYV
jgi:hypothetical protein